jgi:16S rRNA (cytosine1402-N4)-methyltransferase
MMPEYHLPVMASECMDALNIQPTGTYVDVTFGGGGHSKAILNQIGEGGKLFAFDQDPDAVANSLPDPRFVLIQQNFRHLKRYLKLYKIDQVDGLLADLGVSSHQIDIPERGFSYRFDSKLDMRMNPADQMTAADVVNQENATNLQEIFSTLGEVRNSKTLAAHIVAARQQRPIQTIGDLLSVLEPMIRGNKLRYLSQVFQALRMYVNDETGALSDLLHQAYEVLKPGGRLVVLTYHSIEDRMVKNFLKTGNVEGVVEQDFYGVISRPFTFPKDKLQQAGKEELNSNPRARSAKLRVGIKI